MIRVGIIGGAGYTGGELLRILVNHPNVSIVFVSSKSNSGIAVSHIHQDLLGCDLVFSDKEIDVVDVIFTCSGHGEALKYIHQVPIPKSIKIIDLGNDFRLQKDSIQGERRFVYGLPELLRESIITAHNIANPGCFATAIQLGLLPLAQLGELSEVYTTGITGSTGA
ncbi:MAG TPA: N-acetyl-gamma-glutamyl-phosphate reductase, partial [Saprospiraceae bacterium]|nr:N-acetyl-gamma-glutamyl-phosphate reductase [Saprospiraceae bacterium]